MPIRPSPATYRCAACGWSKTVHPHSDALRPGEHFQKCPTCGHQPLKRETANTLLSALGRLLKP